MPDSQKVLIVDDDADIRNMLTQALMHRGLVPDTAQHGGEALELLSQNQYSVIVLDLLMPHVDGFEFLRRMEQVEFQVRPVVLVVTGADHRIVEHLDAQRIHGVVRKPFDPHEVGALVAACAEIRSRPPYEAMAIATMFASGPLLAWLNQIR